MNSMVFCLTLKQDSSVKHWNDRRRGYLDDRRRGYLDPGGKRACNYCA
ncbi:MULTISPECIES: hypothetical protein [unclassified Wolbachia]|nr:hypothetical protein [Wolbachia endosymbiont (group A) of Apoderus coryli]